MSFVDPDAVVEALGHHLKSLGWAFSLNRAGLGWATKRIGTDRKKKVMLTVRIGVKGRRANWKKAQLSVGLYRVGVADGVRWVQDPGSGSYWSCAYYSLARECCENVFGAIEETERVIDFSGDLLATTQPMLKKWLTKKATEWVDETDELAAQIEYIHEQNHMDEDERSLLL